MHSIAQHSAAQQVLTKHSGPQSYSMAHTAWTIVDSKGQHSTAQHSMRAQRNTAHHTTAEHIWPISQ